MSNILKKMLQDLLKLLRESFPEQLLNLLGFPVLKECDDYIARISRIKLDQAKAMQTVIITSDFEDAYTNTDVGHIKETVKEIASLLKLPSDHINLVVGLLDLVFSNCYFFTPMGLFRQTEGMPMGDLSSRDALDVDLVVCEMKILKSLMKSPLKISLFCRLVDDLSIILHGNHIKPKINTKNHSNGTVKQHQQN